MWGYTNHLLTLAGGLSVPACAWRHRYSWHIMLVRAPAGTSLPGWCRSATEGSFHRSGEPECLLSPCNVLLSGPGSWSLRSEIQAQISRSGTGQPQQPPGHVPSGQYNFLFLLPPHHLQNNQDPRNTIQKSNNVGRGVSWCYFHITPPPRNRECQCHSIQNAIYLLSIIRGTKCHLSLCKMYWGWETPIFWKAISF